MPDGIPALPCYLIARALAVIVEEEPSSLQGKNIDLLALADDDVTTFPVGGGLEGGCDSCAVSFRGGGLRQ